jgi:NAD(P) transhydrogenase subunit alpha
VTIIGYTDLPSRLATQASQLYATNLRHLLTDMCPKKDGVLVVDMEDEVVRGATVVKDGTITWPPPAPRLSAAPTGGASLQTGAIPTDAKPQASAGAGRQAGAASGAPAHVGAGPGARKNSGGRLVSLLLVGGAIVGLGMYAPASFLTHFTVFVLACFVGYMVIWNVKPALHTPLMSVTNAISSIIVIGALLQISASDPWIRGIALATVVLTSVNIAGGFAVTRRMLEMFRK